MWKCCFSGGRETAEPGEKHEKPLEQVENQQPQLNPHNGSRPESNPGDNGRLVEGERSQDCAGIPAPQMFVSFFLVVFV